MRQVWTVGEVAQMLDVPEHRIQYLFRSRKIPAVQKLGGRRTFTKRDVLRICTALGVPCPTRQLQEKTAKSAEKW